jgi:hypothetical protein
MSSSNILTPAGSLGDELRTNRNVIHNADFRINQRAAASYATSNGKMNMDRWSGNSNYGAATITQNSTENFPGYFYRATVNTTASLSTGSFFWIASQQVEGNDITSLNLGDPAGRRVNVSFWARSSVSGQYSVMIGVRNSTGTWFYSYRPFTLATTNKWTYISLSFDVDPAYNCPAPTIDNNFSFGVWFVGGVGSTYQSAVQNNFSSSVPAGTASNVNLMATNGATFDLAQVQVEPGFIATPFEFVPVAQQLRRCLRYYQKSYAYATTVGTSTFVGSYGYTWTQQRAHSYSTFSFWYTIPFEARMRAAPTITAYGPSGGSSGVFSIDKGTYVNGTANFNQITDSNFQVYGPNPASLGKAGVEQFYGAYIHYRATIDAAPE